MTSSPTTKTAADRERRFIDYLCKLRDDPTRSRRAMAALRAGLGHKPWTVPSTVEWVVPWLGRQEHPWLEACMFAVAGLFALHRKDWPPSAPEPNEDEEHGPPRSHSMGHSLALLARRQPTTEHQLLRLVNCDRDALLHHLQTSVRILARSEIPIDWAQLLRDILRWNRAIRTRWAKDFYLSHRSDEEER